MKLYVAGFDSECQECGGSIWEGDEYGWIDGLACCVDCVTEYADEGE